MGKTAYIHTVGQCNKILGEKALHPLVSVIDLSKTSIEQYIPCQVGFYSVLLKEYTCHCFGYGRKACDYSDGTLIFLCPGDSIDTENHPDMLCSKGWLLVFHPELLRNTPLAIDIQNYTFFTYNKEESLHIAEREKKVFIRCLENIHEELGRSIDRHSHTLVSRSIGLLLDYCTRFYDRQFITRCEENKRILRKTGLLLNSYYETENCKKTKLLPSATYFADRLNLSPTYFTDLIQQETGQTLYEYINFCRIKIAGKWLCETEKSIDQIACGLGYPSTEYFIRLMEKITGHTPQEYKRKV